MTTIKLKSGSGAPLASDLIAGEPALDLINKRLYTEDLGGNVIEVGTNPTSLTTGTFTSTGIDDNATSTAITIDSSQNVGIGTASPSTFGGYTNLTFGGGANGVNLDFKDSGGTRIHAIVSDSTSFITETNNATPLTYKTNSIERMRIDSSGNVGIGTASPSTDLDVRNNISMGDGTSVTQLSMTRNTANYIAATDASGYLVFRTGGNNERMRIDSSGSVGINGTKTFSEKLIVHENTASSYSTSAMQSSSTAFLVNSANNLSSAATLTLRQFNGTSAISGLYTSTNNGALTFGTSSSTSSGNVVERMRIDSSGNLLVGTTATPASATSQVFANNTKRYYFATKQIASGSTTSFFKVTIPGANTRQVLDFELETSSTSTSHGSTSITSGQILLTRGRFDTNVRIETVINGTESSGPGGFVALTSSGSGNDATFTLQLQSYAPTHNQTCNIHIYSRTTNLTVAAV